MIPTVVIPFNSVVSYSCVHMQIETPAGLIDGSTIQVEFDGNRYHLLNELERGTKVIALDVDTGDVVMLENEVAP